MGHGEQLLPSHTHSSCYTAGKCQPSLGHLTLEANMPYKQQPCSWWQKSVQGTSAAWLYYGVSGRGGQLAAGISGAATQHRLDTDNAAFPHQGTESLGLTQGPWKGPCPSLIHSFVNSALTEQPLPVSCCAGCWPSNKRVRCNRAASPLPLWTQGDSGEAPACLLPSQESTSAHTAVASRGMDKVWAGLCCAKSNQQI